MNFGGLSPIDSARRLAQARLARTGPGATPNTIGTAGESFLAEVTGQGSIPQYYVVEEARFVDRRLGSYNFEVKNTGRRQSYTSFFRGQIAKERSMMRNQRARGSVVIGTQGFSRNAANQARQAGVNVVDLEGYPDIRDFPFD